MRRLGFTMLELIFVIVIMGIIGKFGVEFLAQSYKSFIFSNVNHNLQANGEMAVDSIAAKLQYRIKDSVIARQSANFANFLPLGSASGNTYNILEWVATDIDSFRGDRLPYWSGIIDLDNVNTTATNLVSPETNTTAINLMIQNLGGNGITDAAIFFLGADSDINSYGWANTGGAGAFVDQSMAMHPINAGGNINELVPDVGNFTGVDVYEYYQLAWTAYAVGINDYDSTTDTGTLRLWYNYQPWEGESYLDGNSSIIMENVSTFQFKAVGSVVKIQVCVNSDIVEDYSLCKEKTIF